MLPSEILRLDPVDLGFSLACCDAGEAFDAREARRLHEGGADVVIAVLP